jgi:hypothetical protein
MPRMCGRLLLAARAYGSTVCGEFGRVVPLADEALRLSQDNSGCGIPLQEETPPQFPEPLALLAVANAVPGRRQGLPPAGWVWGG